ncbi:hypothetical protein GCM10027079_02370 [Sediminivirga luteola]|uniref:HNH endonuclease n=1 Tax=Sediminivirga luteola TaxID=1774748 RepID=A0A8J2TX17_9MICO|nr:hypothetical protein GCM10011333_12270 [Sediminivirga luteola]
MITAKQRKTVYERDGGRCVHCGAWDALTIQHRASRGMGGSKAAERFSNWLTLCLVSNTRLEADAEFARLGRDRGWKVSRNGILTPAEVPVIDYQGRSWLLDDNGGRSLVSAQIGA